MRPHFAIRKNQVVYLLALKVKQAFLTLSVEPNVLGQDENQPHCEWGYKEQSIQLPLLDPEEIDLALKSAYP